MTIALKCTNRSGALKLHLEFLRMKFNTLSEAIFAKISEDGKGSARTKNLQPGESFVFAQLPGLYRWTTFELARPAFVMEVEAYVASWSAPKNGAGSKQSAPSCFDCVVCKVSLPRGAELLHGSKYHQFYTATMFKMTAKVFKGVDIPIPHRCELCRHVECLKTLHVRD